MAEMTAAVNGAVQQITYNFLFVLHTNDVSIMYGYRARY